MNDLTLENFHEKTGFRFRVSNEQFARIEASTLTREQAFAEFIAAGGADKLKPRKPEVPDSVCLCGGQKSDGPPVEVFVPVIVVTMLFCLPVILFMVCESFNDYISQ